MVPVFAATSRLVCAKSQALVHGAFLLVRIVVTRAHAESVSEVLIVLVARGWLLGVDPTLGISRRVQSQGTGRSRGQARSATVACKVALGKDLDELVFTMALHRAGVAYSGGIVRVGRANGRRVACQTREYTLTKGSEIFCAVLDTLYE